MAELLQQELEEEKKSALTREGEEPMDQENTKINDSDTEDSSNGKEAIPVPQGQNLRDSTFDKNDVRNNAESQIETNQSPRPIVAQNTIPVQFDQNIMLICQSINQQMVKMSNDMTLLNQQMTEIGIQQISFEEKIAEKIAENSREFHDNITKHLLDVEGRVTNKLTDYQVITDSKIDNLTTQIQNTTLEAKSLTTEINHLDSRLSSLESVGPVSTVTVDDKTSLKTLVSELVNALQNNTKSSPHNLTTKINALRVLIPFKGNNCLPKEFLGDVESPYTLLDITKDRDKILAFQIVVTGKVADWYRAEAETFTTWDGLKSTFLTKYQTEDNLNKKFEFWSSETQDDDTDLEAYATQGFKILEELEHGTRFSSKANKIRETLPNRIREHMRGMHRAYKSPEQFFEDLDVATYKIDSSIKEAKKKRNAGGKSITFVNQRYEGNGSINDYLGGGRGTSFNNRGRGGTPYNGRGNRWNNFQNRNPSINNINTTDSIPTTAQTAPNQAPQTPTPLDGNTNPTSSGLNTQAPPFPATNAPQGANWSQIPYYGPTPTYPSATPQPWGYPMQPYLQADGTQPQKNG